MTYITGTITSADPALAMYTALVPALTAAGYTLVDTVVIGARTHKVWKSPAASNVQALDWYLDVTYTTTGVGSIWLTPYEFYDPATHLAYRGANYNGQTIEQTYFSWQGATGQTLEAAGFFLAAGLATTLAITCSTTAFGYWVSVTADRTLFLNSNQPNDVFYAGFYTPTAGHVTAAGAALFPLVYAKIPYSGSVSGTAVITSPLGVTRIPRAATASIAWLSYIIAPAYGWSASTSLPRIPDGVTTVVASRYVSPIVLSINNNTGAIPAGAIGVLIDLTLGWAASTVARGDTITIDGNPWVASTPAGTNPTTGLFLRAA